MPKDGEGKQDLMDLLGGVPPPTLDAKANAPAPESEKPAADAARSAQPTDKATADKPQPQADDKGNIGQDADNEAKDEDKPLTDEELKAKAREALGIKPKEAETLETWKARFGGLTTTHQQTVAKVKALEGLLAARGLKTVEAKDGLALLADEKHVEKQLPDITNGLFESLSEAEQGLAIEKPEEFAKAVARKVLAKVLPETLKPTHDGQAVEITDATKQATRLELAAEKDTRGNPTHPDFDVLAPFVDDIIASGSLSEKFTKWMNSDADNYRTGLSMLYARAAHKIAPLLAQQADRAARLAQKKAAAENAPEIGDKGMKGGNSTKRTPDQKAADDILKAKPIW